MKCSNKLCEVVVGVGVLVVVGKCFFFIVLKLDRLGGKGREQGEEDHPRFGALINNIVRIITYLCFIFNSDWCVRSIKQTNKQTVQFSAPLDSSWAGPWQSCERLRDAAKGRAQWASWRGHSNWCVAVPLHVWCDGGASLAAECGTNILLKKHRNHFFKTTFGALQKSVTGSDSMCKSIMASHF